MILEYLFVTAEQDPGQWVFPKGRIEPRESPDAAALRGVKEEAGVAAKIIEKLPSLDLATNSIAMFLMWPVDCAATSEGRQIQWFGVDQALIQLTFDESRQLLRKVHSRMLSRI